jgi:anti-sigma B factor antagonist
MADMRLRPSAVSAGSRAVNLTVSSRDEGETHRARTVVEVAGEIDLYTSARLREHLVDLVTAGRYHLIVDLERVDFLDTTGLGVLVGALTRVRAHGGCLQLVCTRDRILKVLRVTGVTTVFQVHTSVEEAMNAGV